MSLADVLRTLDDAGLAALLRRRPDLVVPVPTDLAALAARAQTRHSTARALDTLDEFTLRVLDAVRLARDADGVARAAAIAEYTAPAAAPAAAALATLRAGYLVYGPPDTLRVAGGVDEVCGPYPAGLGRPAVQLSAAAATLAADPARLRRAVLAAPPPARAVLERLAAGPPVGTVSAAADNGRPERRSGGRRGRESGPDPDSPVVWLVDAHLLAPTGVPAGAGDPARYESVELPREVGLLLRRDTGALGPLRPTPPPVGPTREQGQADAAGAGQAMEAVRQADALLAALAAEQVVLLRTGGVGVQPLRRLARAAGVDEPTAALLLEVCAAAGLVAEVESQSVPGLLPTPRYDTWRVSPLAARWSALADAWWVMPRQPGLVGSRDDRDRPVNALAAEVERSGAPVVRRAVLAALAALGDGAAPGDEALVDHAAWRWPRRVLGREAAARQAAAEAARLGVTGRGALTSYGRLLLTPVEPADEDPLGVRGAAAALDPLAVALDPLLPAPVDHVLLQADLTVVVPGPPEPTLAAELELAADHESGGGADVYRVTEASVRRALDAGYTTDDLHGLFGRRSRTPVPQTLTYLVDDLGRRHGGLRAGSAAAYLRSDDEALLAEAAADRRLAPLALRRLAATVLVSPFPQARLVQALRDAGYAPVPEDAAGAAVLASPRTRRAPGGAAPRRPVNPAVPALTDVRLAGIVDQLRRGEARASTIRRAPAALRAAQGQVDSGPAAVQSHTEAIAVLQQAVRDRRPVWVGYVDPHGATLSRLLLPVSLAAGYLRAEDERTETLHTFALHRITAAVPA
ncbi:hypothetical protein GCM10010124_10920 [Pilimelia terevasa]|uniref:Helicase XPB/Ssl2 N-terminal domain-containing protein n=1 Tax=Pilimelia terevasa TaxID=53372 RepID=A0A8J3FIP9_9ACTN|nr:helicase-associated domain-containing protein [Pilimelia terevasa]GGK20133.1 hypothetical protein GCM10010124_10920 [Pilimelia terevasa]